MCTTGEHFMFFVEESKQKTENATGLVRKNAVHCVSPLLPGEFPSFSIRSCPSFPFFQMHAKMPATNRYHHEIHELTERERVMPLLLSIPFHLYFN